MRPSDVQVKSSPALYRPPSLVDHPSPCLPPSETLPGLEQQLAERLLDFERLDEAWPFSHLPRVAVRKGRG